MYKKKRLLQPGVDPDYPLGFFNKSWAGRGHDYRTYLEPVDIANWCGLSLARHPSAVSRWLLHPDGSQRMSFLIERSFDHCKKGELHLCSELFDAHCRYYKNKNVEARPPAVPGHYVDLPNGQELPLAQASRPQMAAV